MKKILALTLIVLCLASTTAFASRGIGFAGVRYTAPGTKTIRKSSVIDQVAYYVFIKPFTLIPGISEENFDIKVVE